MVQLDSLKYEENEFRRGVAVILETVESHHHLKLGIKLSGETLEAN